jgi:alginate O-acetyltransferase complex protein AlgI
MAFTSHIFLFYFLALVLLVYYLLRGKRNLVLLCASHIFYGWLNPFFLILICFITVVNYTCSRIMVGFKSRQRPRFLALLICFAANLGTLGFFKYVMFFQSNAGFVLDCFGKDALPMLHVVLPIGISFYTFKSLSYCIDVYRGDCPPARSLFHFACFVSFFPQLMAGPIQRYDTIDSRSEQVPTFAEQLVNRTHTLDKFSFGVALFILGFAKKILLADCLGRCATAVFAAESPGMIDVWFGAGAYTFQLYFDFSAYSNMAIGLGAMLGFACPRNFNAPYLAESVTDFWRRWHISLSSWFRDYLYIPLGGNRRGPARAYFNLIVVFLLCGLWHGANWTFVIWGGYHGLFFVFERFIGKKGLYAALPRVLRISISFVLILVSWVFFRSENMAQAFRFLAIMFQVSPPQGGSILLAGQIYTQGNFIMIALGALLVFQRRQAFDWAKTMTLPKAIMLILLFSLSIMMMFAQSFTSFLYFKF